MVSHRRPANHRKRVGLAILLAVALTATLTSLTSPTPPTPPTAVAGAFPTGAPHQDRALTGANRSAAARLAVTHTSPSAITLKAGPAAVKKAAHHVILVVGDSLVAQAAGRLWAASNFALRIEVAAELGSAPCDWTTGRFDAELTAVHPDTVVLAFVGNAGLSSGCVSTKQAFPLSELLANYRINLTALADRSTAAGATVIIATPPARNPGTPPPPDNPTIGARAKPDQFYGYQGVPAIRELYAQLVAANQRWHLTNAPALAISPGFIYKQILSCNADDGSCPDGFVAVRTGRNDAIHLDETGNGAKRYAEALVASAIAIADRYPG